MIGSQSFVGSSVEDKRCRRGTYSTAVLIIVVATVLVVVVVRHDGCVFEV
jgi:hypothetical protein